MAVFEVFIPARDAGSPNVTLTIEGRNWIEALRSGLKSIGEGGEAIANVMCDVKEDASIHVTDVSTRRVFRLREQKAPAGEGATQEAASQPDDAPRTLPPEAPRPVSVPPTPGVPSAADAMAPSPKTMMQFPAFKPPPADPAPAASFAHEETTRMPVPPSSPPEPAPAPPTVAAAEPPAAVAAPKVPDPDQSVPWTKMPGPEQSAAAELKAAVAAAVPPPAPAKPPAPKPPPPKDEPHKPAALARTTTPGPFARDTPVAGIVPKPATGSQKAVSQQVVENDTTKVPVFKSTTDETERVDRAPRSAVAPPTPRGVPAPRRASGQFALAQQPQVREESRPLPTDPKIGRPVAPAVDVTDAIAAVFDATQDLYLEQRLGPEKVAATLLDIALAHIPAESGTFYLASVNAHELTFAAVRGPKADQLKRSGMTVPLGQGIIGFCAQEGICLSVSDIQKDPRWLSSIGKKLDYLPKDTLCASAEKDGRLFGAVQLINSKRGFDAAHMEVLRFIGLTAAALLERIEASG